ncbi:MAG TPA: cell division protein FtsQ/DivIB [Steroidobacteraceae bacterium]|jgi:cell division protein FtsQ
MLNRKRNNRRSPPRSGRFKLPALNWRRLGLSLGGIAVTVLALAALGWLLDQPIQRVIVSGRLQRVSALDVEKVVRARLRGAGLVTVQLDQIGEGLRTLPWVDSAAVQRSWPRGLKIEIVEQTAVARWNDNGLVNARGQLFMSDAHFVPPELPQLTGPTGSEAEVTARYLAAQGRLTEVGLRLVALSLDARGALNMTLDNGVQVRLGRDQIDARFERFLLVAAKLVSQRAADIAYVDMRYGNGFAVGWKGGAAHLAGGSTREEAHLHG